MNNPGYQGQKQTWGHPPQFPDPRKRRTLITVAFLVTIAVILSVTLVASI